MLTGRATGQQKCPLIDGTPCIYQKKKNIQYELGGDSGEINLADLAGLSSSSGPATEVIQTLSEKWINVFGKYFCIRKHFIFTGLAADKIILNTNLI